MTLCTVLISAVDGEILLLPALVCFFVKTQKLLPIYSSPANDTQSYYINFCHVACVFHSHSCLQR